ncbi:HEPN domain protein [Ferroglobus placidus DSM 10642]|uniref:HEPN domain protein n=1 Tax=Ferroglobus placidus (strain DSM 10642 / AEDII12DO) TaxID=589924 RepID=D3S243_FERPA|nr:HEPN domain-containing protein [Ferroglobus placidus]ADC66534.1 HEPN domain protein [Ferroglobus placidus DSM 10642]
MKEEVKVYLERSKKFERDAKFDFDNGDYDLAMFHIEQAMQLLIKAKLLDLKGYFERTHSLRKLLSELKDVEGVEDFLKKYKIVLRNLERAYVTSRYYFEEFFREEVEEAFKALEELRRILWKEQNTS